MEVTMANSNYFTLLKDPRWQKKRLEIMNRDGFKCQDCGHDDLPLNIHHKYYIYGMTPWDYDNDILITLCEECHQQWEYDKSIINDFTKVLLVDGWTPKQLDDLLRLFRELTPLRNDIEQLKALIHRAIYANNINQQRAIDIIDANEPLFE